MLVDVDNWLCRDDEGSTPRKKTSELLLRGEIVLLSRVRLLVGVVLGRIETLETETETILGEVGVGGKSSFGGSFGRGSLSRLLSARRRGREGACVSLMEDKVPFFGTPKAAIPSLLDHPPVDSTLGAVSLVGLCAYMLNSVREVKGQK